MPDWARTIARRVLYEAADELRLEQLKASGDPDVAGLAAKIDREEAYHRMHAQMWADRLAGEPRYREALDELFPAAVALLDEDLRTVLAARFDRNSEVTSCYKVMSDGPYRRVAGALGRDDDGAAIRAGCGMVTEAEGGGRGGGEGGGGGEGEGEREGCGRGREGGEGGWWREGEVWAALAEVADPEIPVVSLVDLGVVRDVRVEDDRVHVAFTPTFLGCPALEVMRDELAAKVADLGAEPDIEVIRDDSWSTDRITPEGREKLRAAGFAPPAPRMAGETTLVQLQTGSFRCPYCGSTDTKLENIFGPTPCSSIRYCNACRQPFEQFKTI